MLRIAMRNVKIYPIFTLSGWHALERGSSCTLELDSTHGMKTRETNFIHMCLGQHTEYNRGHKVVLLHDPRSSPY